VRDTCLYVSITANIAIAAAYTQQQIQDANLLLFIPFASTLFFWVYATNDAKITQIRQYIVETLLPRLSNADANSAPFGWEYLRRRSFRRYFLKIARMLVVWITFSGASILALAATASGFGFTAIWVVALAFAALPYIFGLFLLDL
jgi:hypothetical protein